MLRVKAWLKDRKMSKTDNLEDGKNNYEPGWRITIWHPLRRTLLLYERKAAVPKFTGSQVYKVVRSR